MTADCWVPVPGGSDFPLENLPYGIFRPASGEPRAGVAIGQHVLDLAAVAEAGLVDGEELFRADTLHPFLGAGPETWSRTRGSLRELLGEEAHRPQVEPALHLLSEVELLVPIRPGDYVDFYSSLEHATNMGRLFRPEGDPLLPNWRWLPVAYHGRSSSVVVSGTPVVRPRGQIKEGDEPPRLAATLQLDFELEVGFVTGAGNLLGEPIPAGQARRHIFGIVLVNDWSARDVQAWEYVPLGPFLGKSFATSISPWVVPLEALEPYRVPGPPQDPPPLDYLRVPEPRGLDLHLEVAIAGGGWEQTVCRTNLRSLYWSMDQQLAHASANGAPVRPGDLYASGTVSGWEPGTQGSLIELTRRGAEPLGMPDGSGRGFLEDGDTVVMRGWCGGGGRPRLGLGEVRGTILPARTD